MPNVMRLRDGAFGMYLGQEGEASWVKLVPLKKRLQRAPLPHPPCEITVRRQPSIGQQALSSNRSAGALAFDSSSVRSKCLLFIRYKVHNIFYSSPKGLRHLSNTNAFYSKGCVHQLIQTKALQKLRHYPPPSSVRKKFINIKHFLTEPFICKVLYSFPACIFVVDQHCTLFPLPFPLFCSFFVCKTLT